MRTKNDLISKKIELELGSEIKIHEEDNQYLTNSNHVYMSKNIPGDSTYLRTMLFSVQNKYTQEDRRLVSVVVPQYPDYDDTQFAITGSCKADENIEKAVQREILEEIGLFVDISNITKLAVKSSVTYFHVTLENSITPYEANLQQKTEMVEMAKMDKVDDDKTNKVCIIMTLNETNINKIYGRKRLTSSDIAGKTIAIIPLKKMIEFTTTAEFPEKQKRSYHQKK
jgi:ADP-ribose pyrophosphatase YjhB (NUDIX family)